MDEKQKKQGEPHTDAAEGERDTVDESLREHERKGDLKETEKKKGR